MLEAASRIFDYLPFEPGAETQYIQYLWDAFTALEEKDSDAQYFSIVPFHLLFMLAVQYKVYRLAGYDTELFVSFVEQCRIYRNEDKAPVISNIPLSNSGVWDANKGSVKTLALVGEKSLFHFFDIVGIDEYFKKKACDLVNNRNDRFHANGKIDELAEEKITAYLEILDHLQSLFTSNCVNESIQGSWADDVEPGEYPLDEFITEKLLYSQFSPLDFGDLLYDILISDNLDCEQWQQFAEKGVELCPARTQEVLKQITQQNSLGDSVKLNAQQYLEENF